MNPIETPNADREPYTVERGPWTVEPESPYNPPSTPKPRNGYRRAVASVLAAVTLTVLVYTAVLALTAGLTLSRDRAIILAVILGLHSFALTILTGDSPWPHLTKLLAGSSREGEDPPP